MYTVLPRQMYGSNSVRSDTKNSHSDMHLKQLRRKTSRQNAVAHINVRSFA